MVMSDGASDLKQIFEICWGNVSREILVISFEATRIVHQETRGSAGFDLLRMADSSRGLMLYSFERERAMKECWRNQTEINKTNRKTSFQDIEREGEGDEDEVEETQER
jgi:hypothetical protein